MKWALVVAAMLVSVSASASGENWVLTPAGLGPVRIGMSMSQVSKALGGKLVGDAIEDEESCVEKSSSAGPPDTSYMFEGGKLTRISVYEESPVKTPRGIGVGSSEEAIRKAYGKLDSEPHTYLDMPALYLTYWLRDDVGVRFETDEKRRVDIIHAGTGSIRYIEGCA